MRKYTILFILAVFSLALFFKLQTASVNTLDTKLWQFSSIDTMKYSRDLSREKLTDPLFDKTIDAQMQAIENTGATHVAIATPYDDEFLPILTRWVTSARAHHLHIWFRGNWSGWEGWFGYPTITRVEHIQKTKAFILNHPDLFQNGDVFTACPECENGGPGDPRKTGDIAGYRAFLIDEYSTTKDAFKQIHKNVPSNYDSMNADVAKLVMDTNTTAALDGIVTIDHYVATPEKMIHDITDLSESSGGKIVIGEFGAPIPDIHGQMTEGQQAEWLKSVLTGLAETQDVVGLNYWTSTGGTTELWGDNMKPRIAVKTLTDFYTFKKVLGTVIDETNTPIKQAKVTSSNLLLYTDAQGNFVLPYIPTSETIAISAPGFQTKSGTVSNTNGSITIVLKKTHESLFFMLKKHFKSLFHLK